MSHCPYLLHKLLFDYYSVCLIYSSYQLLAPAPPGCYIYVIIKMIEIYNTAEQPYYSGELMYTALKRTPLTYLSSEKKMLRYQLCSTRYVAV